MSEYHGGRALERIAAELSMCAEGLRFTSETDAPFVPFVLECAVTASAWPGELAELLGASDVRVKSIDEALRGQVDVHPADVEAAALVPRFRKLIELFHRRLDSPQAVWIAAENARYRVLLIGVAPGGIAGLETLAVES